MMNHKIELRIKSIKSTSQNRRPHLLLSLLCFNYLFYAHLHQYPNTSFYRYNNITFQLPRIARQSFEEELNFKFMSVSPNSFEEIHYQITFLIMILCLLFL
jgi:hypothetical protein